MAFGIFIDDTAVDAFSDVAAAITSAVAFHLPSELFVVSLFVKT